MGAGLYPYMGALKINIKNLIFCNIEKIPACKGLEWAGNVELGRGAGQVHGVLLGHGGRLGRGGQSDHGGQLGVGGGLVWGALLPMWTKTTERGEPGHNIMSSDDVITSVF